MNAFNQRDLKALLTYMDSTVQFFAPETASSVGRKSLYRGHDGVREFFDDVATVWEGLNLVPQDFRYTDDCVVVIGRVTGERSGETVDRQAARAWKLRE